MSIQLQARLAYLLPFAGVPSYDRQIARLRADLQPHGGIEGLAAEIDAVSEEVEDIELNGEVTDRGISAHRNIYVNSVTGDDANNGAGAGAAIKTFTRLLELINRVDAFYIRIEGELVVDKRVNLIGAITRWQFLGHGAGGTIRFVDVGASVGGFVGFGGGMVLFQSLTLIDDTTNAAYPFYFLEGGYHLGLNNVDVVNTAQRVASGKPHALMWARMMEIVAVAFSVDDKTDGRFIAQIPAGGDPNAVRGFRSNTTFFG